MTIGLPGETKWGAAWLTAMEPGVEVTMTELVGELMVTMGFGRLNLMGPNCSSVASQMPSMGGSHAANMELALSSGISEALSTKSIPLAEKQFSMSASLACMCTLVLVRLTSSKNSPMGVGLIADILCVGWLVMLPNARTAPVATAESSAQQACCSDGIGALEMRP